MSNYIFTLATQEDADKVMDFYHSLIGTPFCTWALDYPDEKVINHDIHNKSLYLLMENDEIISAAAAGVHDELDGLKWSAKNLCDVSRFGVSHSKQHQGVGKQMLYKIIAAVKEKGFDGIRMIVRKGNLPALALYEKNGFVRCGETSLYVHEQDLEFHCYEMIFKKSQN